MIRHLVAWKFVDQPNGMSARDCALEMKKRLEELAPRIAGLQALHVGIERGNPAHFDGLLDSTFEDMDSLNAYLVHPEHLAISAFCKGVRSARVGVDYEI